MLYKSLHVQFLDLYGLEKSHRYLNRSSQFLFLDLKLLYEKF